MQIIHLLSRKYLTFFSANFCIFSLTARVEKWLSGLWIDGGWTGSAAMHFTECDKRGDTRRNKNATKSSEAVLSCLEHAEWEGRNRKPCDPHSFIKTEVKWLIYNVDLIQNFKNKLITTQRNIRHNPDVQYLMNMQYVRIKKRATLWHSLHFREVFDKVIKRYVYLTSVGDRWKYE
jgi:hypothetical protein